MEYFLAKEISFLSYIRRLQRLLYRKVLELHLRHHLLL
jgi:hypothetical protein